jgi:LemA protein
VTVSGWITLTVIAAIVLYLISIYNHLVRLNHNVSQAWSNIDVLLKQRHDEIPKLVDTCKAYMRHEQDTLLKVTQARTRVMNAANDQNVASLGLAEGALREGLDQLFMLAEDYPDLKANDSFQHLQSRITGLESSIADRREYYNASVNLLNVRVDQIPDLFIARLCGFKHRALLEFAAHEKADVHIGQLFGRS